MEIKLNSTVAANTMADGHSRISHEGLGYTTGLTANPDMAVPSFMNLLKSSPVIW